MNPEEQHQKIEIRFTDELWNEFNKHTIEVETDKPFHPKLEYDVQGLADARSYAMFLGFYRVDRNCYNYIDKKWIPVSESDQSIGELNGNVSNIMQKCGVMTGNEWKNRRVVRFDNIELTTDPSDKHHFHVNVTLNCKYVPVLTIFEWSPNRLPSEPYLKFITNFKSDHTEFIAVKEYQNPWFVEKLIINPPFQPIPEEVFPSPQKLDELMIKLRTPFRNEVLFSIPNYVRLTGPADFPLYGRVSLPLPEEARARINPHFLNRCAMLNVPDLFAPNTNAPLVPLSAPHPTPILAPLPAPLNFIPNPNKKNFSSYSTSIIYTSADSGIPRRSGG